MKIYDCFCYFDEDLILKLRLETLWLSVDYFLISEASYSHVGKERQLNFDMSRFSKYQQKIRYLPLHNRPSGDNDAWKNENFIRNNITNGLFDAQPNDLIIISDLDEIPNPEAIARYDQRYLRGDFKQRCYSYYLNNYRLGEVDRNNVIVPGSEIYEGSKITTYEHFVGFFKSNPSMVRIYKSQGLLRSIRRAWFRKFNVQHLWEGGWHFTWISDMEGLIKKIENTAHQEFNNAFYKDNQRIRDMIGSGRDFHIPAGRYQLQPLDAQFPKYLLSHPEEFQEFLSIPKAD